MISAIVMPVLPPAKPPANTSMSVRTPISRKVFMVFIDYLLWSYKKTLTTIPGIMIKVLLVSTANFAGPGFLAP